MCERFFYPPIEARSKIRSFVFSYLFLVTINQAIMASFDDDLIDKMVKRDPVIALQAMEFVKSKEVSDKTLEMMAENTGLTMDEAKILLQKSMSFTDVLQTRYGSEYYAMKMDEMCKVTKLYQQRMIESLIKQRGKKQKEYADVDKLVDEWLGKEVVEATKEDIVMKINEINTKLKDKRFTVSHLNDLMNKMTEVTAEMVALKEQRGKNADNGKVDTAVKFCMYALEMKRLREKMGYLIVRRNEHYDREGVVFFDKVKESLVEWEFAFMNMVELKRGSFAYVALVPLDKIDLAYDLLCLRFESMDMQKPDHEYKKFYDLDIVDFIDWALGENKIPFYSVKHDVTM